MNLSQYDTSMLISQCREVVEWILKYNSKNLLHLTIKL